MAAIYVIKRNGARADFDGKKVASALKRAFMDVYPSKPEEALSKSAGIVASMVVERVDRLGREEVSIEDIQNITETTLMEFDQQVAKAYILYRNKRAEIRVFKASLGVQDDELKMPLNSLTVLSARYLKKDESGRVIETPKQLFYRVSNAIAEPERGYGKSEVEVAKIALDFYSAMTNFEFMPNSPTLMNAGTELGQLSACFVLPVGDSIEEIFDALKYAAVIHKSGGGTGFAFSRLRPSNDIVKGSNGVSSGPISFMRIFNSATEEIKQGGKRRGANMGILRIDHPDVLNFIMSKDVEGAVRNFNISVAVTDAFMKALSNDGEYELINPRSKRAVGKLNARAVWNLIVTMAWKTGDPGLIFIDRINASYANPVPKRGPIESTNPCISGDTMISTAAGLYRADELASMRMPNLLLVDKRFGTEERQLSSPVLMTGVKPVVRLSTKEGFGLKLTKDHKVYSEERGWVESAMLRKGEKIRIASTASGFGKEGNTAEGRVLGWLTGNGHINNGPGNDRALLSFYNDDMVLAEQFDRDVNSIIRPPVSKNHANGAGVVVVQDRMVKTITSERLKEFAIEWGLREEKLIVPDKVFRGSEELQRGFLQALFEADGTLNASQNGSASVRLTSASGRLLRDVQLLLLNFGIYSKIYRNRKRDGIRLLPGSDRGSKAYKIQSYHDLTITGTSLGMFGMRIGFLSERKVTKLSTTINSYTGGQYKTDWTATISSVESCGVECVFDLTEPVTHSFVANGVVIANCGEQPLYPYDSCNLGSINLAKMVKRDGDHYEVDWDKLERTVRLGVRFLDNVIDANKYPIKQIDDVSHAIRRIGLGIMGWADMLIKLGIVYNSNEALLLAERVMGFINEKGREMSEELASERGPFPEFKDSIWHKLGYKPLRNSTVTTIAPTGTISIITGGASQGIEPLFSVAYMRNVKESLGSNLIEVDNEFEHYALEYNFYSDELMKKIAGRVSIQDVEEIPDGIRQLFVTAFDISPEWHVKMQAAFQKYTDNAVSKTINFPNYATPQDIENAYMLAYKLGCKGITVYRDGSKSIQVLQAIDKGGSTEKQRGLHESKQEHMKKQETVKIAALRDSATTYVLSPAKQKACSSCGSNMIAAEGCFICPKCGYSECS